MKLHLPKLLRSAVLACIASVAGVTATVGTATVIGGAVLFTLTPRAAAGDLTISSVSEYSGSEGGSYKGVVFNLSTIDATRAAVTGGELTDQVTLNSISLTERGGYNLDTDRILYITDADNVYLGSSSVFTKAEGSDVAVFDFEGSITLNAFTTYYAYLLPSAGDDAWTAGETVDENVQFYSGPLAAVGGSLSTVTAAGWGLLNGQKTLASTAYAPVMTIAVSTIGAENRIYWEGSSDSDLLYWNSDSWAEEDGALPVANKRPAADSWVVFSGNAGSPHIIYANNPQSVGGAEFSNGSYQIKENNGNSGHLTLTGNLNLLADASLVLDVKLTAAGVNMAGGTSLTLNDTVTLTNDGKITINGAGAAISLGSGVSLSSAQVNTSTSGATVVLSGAGTYTVEGSGATLGGVSCHETDWTGTVNLVGVALNGTTTMDKAGNAGSTVVLSDCSGWIVDDTVASDIVLAGEAGETALAINNGSSYDDENGVMAKF